MYFLTLFLLGMTALLIIALNKNKGSHIIPDFQLRYGREDLESFRAVPKKVIRIHYVLDSWYILSYSLTCIAISSISPRSGIPFWWAPAVLGILTAILDMIENRLLKGYYYRKHEMPRPIAGSRLTLIKGIFAWGWFATALPCFFWLSWQKWIS